jgi:hypothetical protein
MGDHRWRKRRTVLAGHLSIMGYKVRLYDVFPATVDAINAQGGIIVDGVVEGFGKPELVTTDIGKAIAGRCRHGRCAGHRTQNDR